MYLIFLIKNSQMFYNKSPLSWGMFEVEMTILKILKIVFLSL